jgi:Sulfotransferase family
VAGPDREADPLRYFIVHIQKTAGSSLRRRLVELFGEAAVYPTRRVDGTDPYELVLSIDHLRRQFAERRVEIRVVIGHFPLCVTELLDGEFATLTILREPVDRTLSYLRHHRQTTPADRDKSLERIYAEPFRFQGFVHNHMTKMLALTPGEMTAGMLTPIDLGHDHLERAKERLAGLDAVGHQERFGEFCEQLSRRFGWALGEPEVTNATEPVEVAPEFRARIAEDNRLDVELHEFARTLEDRSTSGAPS